MPNENLVQNCGEEEEYASDTVMSDISPDYGNSGGTRDEGGPPSEVISFDAHSQLAEKRSHKLNSLKFHPLSLPQNLSPVDPAGNPMSSGIRIQAQLRGRFSHSEDSSLSGQQEIVSTNNKDDAIGISNGMASKDTIGLIFYRRNKFKVTGTVSIPSGLDGIKLQDSRASKITSLHAELTAIESLEGTPVRLIYANVREKGYAASFRRQDALSSRGTNPISDALPKVDLLFDEAKYSDDKSSTTNHEGLVKEVAINWDKLQFRHATAKKRGTWQYFYLRLTLVATLEDGKNCIIGRSQSSAITVRGRSPQSFPGHTSKTSKVGSTNKQLPPAKNFTLSNSTSGGIEDQVLLNETQWSHSPLDLPSVDYQSTFDAVPENLLFYDFSDLGIWNNSSNGVQWQESNSASVEAHDYLKSVDACLSSTNPSDNNNHDKNSYEPDYSNNLFIPSTETHLLPSVPNLGSIFNLTDSLASLSADYSNLRDMTVAPSSPFTLLPSKAGPESRGASSRAITGSFASSGSGNEQTASLECDDGDDETDDERKTYSYEYIPLSINDWTVPVDAVYRPHGIHARKVPSSEKSITKKRYFLAVN